VALSSERKLNVFRLKLERIEMHEKKSTIQNDFVKWPEIWKASEIRSEQDEAGLEQSELL
jgi:hypothetical protein